MIYILKQEQCSLLQNLGILTWIGSVCRYSKYKLENVLQFFTKVFDTGSACSI